MWPSHNKSALRFLLYCVNLRVFSVFVVVGVVIFVSIIHFLLRLLRSVKKVFRFANFVRICELHWMYDTDHLFYNMANHSHIGFINRASDRNRIANGGVKIQQKIENNSEEESGRSRKKNMKRDRGNGKTFIFIHQNNFFHILIAFSWKFEVHFLYTTIILFFHLEKKSIHNKIISIWAIPYRFRSHSLEVLFIFIVNLYFVFLFKLKLKWLSLNKLQKVKGIFAVIIVRWQNIIIINENYRRIKFNFTKVIFLLTLLLFSMGTDLRPTLQSWEDFFLYKYNKDMC